MEKDNLSKSIFIILLLSLFITLLYTAISKIKEYDFFSDEKKVFVNIDEIIIPDEKTFTYTELSQKDFELESFVSPKLISEKNYIYIPRNLPVNQLNALSTEALNQLKADLETNLNRSFDSSLQKNLFIAYYLDSDKIEKYENEVRELLRAKLTENSKFKYESYLNYITSNELVQLMNTNKNRYTASKNFSHYLTNRNTYLNLYYLFNTNIENFKKQEQLKREEEIAKDFQKYKKEQLNDVNSKIANSKKITDHVILNIKNVEKNQVFSFKPVENIKKELISHIDFENKKVSVKNFLHKKEKEKIIKQIASDHNLKVTFNKKSDADDYTEKIQYYLNNYYYLYIM